MRVHKHTSLLISSLAIAAILAPHWSAHELVSELNVARLSFALSCAALYISWRSRKIAVRTYALAVANDLKSRPHPILVTGKQCDSFYLVHLALMHPSSPKLIIYNLSVMQQSLSHPGQWILRSDAIWWPTDTPTKPESNSYVESYRGLLIEDYGDILIKIPSIIPLGMAFGKESEVFDFAFDTNYGPCSIECNIRAPPETFGSRSLKHIYPNVDL